MKIGFLFQNTYNNPAALDAPIPSPPSLFDPVIGQRSMEEGLAMVRLVDELDFDFVSLSEHHAMSLLLTPNIAVTGAALSQILKNAALYLLGPLVSINNPIRVAEEIAMLDQLMRGKLQVGLLRGAPNELTVYNNLDPAESRSVTKEAIQLIERALSEPEIFAHKGRHFDFPKVAVWPGVTQRPFPRFFTSGSSEESVRFAAENRYKVAFAFYDEPSVATLSGMYRSECAKAGWTPTADDMLHRAYCIVGRDDEHARELQERFFPGHIRDIVQPKEIGTDADGKNRANPHLPFGFSFGFLQFVGGPQTVIRKIRQFADATGVGIFDLSLVGGGLAFEESIEMVERFGREVLPHLREDVELRVAS